MQKGPPQILYLTNKKMTIHLIHILKTITTFSPKKKIIIIITIKLNIMCRNMDF